jgi:Fe-S cluster biogenesis protein NfuA
METSLRLQIQNIEALVARLKAVADPVVCAAGLELVQNVMAFHAAGLDRMMEIVSEADDGGWELIEKLGRDEIAGNMLLLHGMHPVDFDTRVRRSLEKVRPYLRSHGGDVELLSTRGGAVRLRLTGSCHGCPSSTMTLKSAIEKALLEGAPDAVSIECEGASELAANQKG